MYRFNEISATNSHTYNSKIMLSNDIRTAKQIGKLLKSSREAQFANLKQLSLQCGLSVAQLVHLENGNLFAFERNLERMIGFTYVYAHALNVDVNTLGQDLIFSTINNNPMPVESYIPRFLLK